MSLRYNAPQTHPQPKKSRRMTAPAPRQTRPIDSIDTLGPLSLRRLEVALGLLIGGFIVLVVVDLFRRISSPPPFLILLALHNHLGRFTLLIAVLMFALAAYIGLVRRGDVTPYFLRGTLVVWGTMIGEALLGLVMLIGYGAQAGHESHYIYGAGAVLALPFFVYVERTSPKRPAMGSYLWGFGLMAGIIVRCLSTGVIGG